MCTLDTSLSADELLMQGNKSCTGGFYKDAISEYTASISKNRTAQAFNNRGYAYYRSVDMDIPLLHNGNKQKYIEGIENAIKDFEEALKIDPNYKQARDNSILMSEQKRKYE
jgi:tetratricopeptide (TPR) repeat protein